MTAKIIIARNSNDLDGLPEMLREFLTWDIDQLRAISGIDVDVESYLDNTFAELDLYFPPDGRLLCAREDRRLVGVGFLKPIGEEISEIKRMYVHPDQRGKGLGKAILTRLINEAKDIGYKRILLDSACYMTAAHALYRSMGFTDVDYYPAGETDESFQQYMVYMEKRL